MPFARGEWTARARDILPTLRRWREAFHRDPELANQEHRTRRRLKEALSTLEITARTYDGFTGVVGLIDPGRTGPVVALRADMDALPVEEETGLRCSSHNAGVMHACGHDVHMTCLLGAAALLQSARHQLAGPVKLLFQPAEEQGQVGGAKPFIDRGCLKSPSVDFVLGQHVAPEIPTGMVGTKPGPLLAAADDFEIIIHGTQGHAAYPQRGPDAVVVAADIVHGLQTIVSRSRDPLDPVVISVGSIHGGTRPNILPGRVTLVGTVRTLRSESRRAAHRLILQRVRHIAQSWGARAEVLYKRGYPATINDAGVTAHITEIFRREMGSAKVRGLDRPVMGAEDFSRYLERVPGSFWFLGAGRPGRKASLHSPSFSPPDETLVVGTAALAAAAVGVSGNA